MPQGSDPWACEGAAGSTSTLRPVSARAATTGSNVRIGQKCASPRIGDHSILAILRNIVEWCLHRSCVACRQPSIPGVLKSLPVAWTVVERRIVRRIARRAGITKAISPQTLRHAFITSFDAGVPLRDVQEAASHADPRTTMRDDRARGSLDRHAAYIVAAYLASAAWYPALPAPGH